ncbi:DMT family transporter [Pseudoalteromonas sp. MMG013]|uniref:DMT family transporter n=1 Tax=Pseudoalteromonas sp. MMG013 TaxID=2822687 RepID=UPI001B3884BB|nr:DMT family transporter [Pseudoalteromonas sp. MMG013]MBQ4860199.1 DMT family transporter [Pseudoalteromonas sp. MMG013]
MSLILYFLLVFVWGLSWIAIKWQQGDVALEVSIFYRFFIAAVIMLVMGKFMNKLQHTSGQDHVWFALQGASLFCFNFIAFYVATSYIPSGLVALLMATAPLFNSIHGRLFFGAPITFNFVLGMLFGLVGIGFLFANELSTLQLSLNTLYGVLYSLVGTWCFSIGNMLSVKNTNKGIRPFTATSYAMIYGCVCLLSIIFFKQLNFNFELTTLYIGSLLYLSIPASVLGFTAFLVLVNRIGASNAAYILVCTPVIALTMSSIFEGYVWTFSAGVGLVLICLGNVVSRMHEDMFNLAIRLFKWRPVRLTDQ